MAKFVLTNPSISVGGVQLEDHVASVSVTESYAEVATTAFGDTAVTRIAGLGDHSISLDFHEDFRRVKFTPPSHRWWAEPPR